MKVTIENGELVVRIPVQDPPVPSATGKTLVVASSKGNIKTATLFNGKQLVVGLNAYVAKD